MTVLRRVHKKETGVRDLISVNGTSITILGPHNCTNQEILVHTCYLKKAIYLFRTDCCKREKEGFHDDSETCCGAWFEGVTYKKTDIVWRQSQRGKTELVWMCAEEDGGYIGQRKMNMSWQAEGEEETTQMVHGCC